MELEPQYISVCGRIHGELLRLLFILADRKTTLSLQALGEAVDVDSEVYCRRRSGIFWRMRASLGLPCAQAATLCTQVVGGAAPSLSAKFTKCGGAAPGLGTIFWFWVFVCALTGCCLLFSLLFICSFCYACSSEVTVTSVSLPSFVSHRGLFIINLRLSLSPLTKARLREPTRDRTLDCIWQQPSPLNNVLIKSL